MWTIVRALLACGVVALAGAVEAQAQGFFNDRIRGDVALLTFGSVQKELKLTDQQIEKITDVARDRQQRGEEVRERFRQTPPQERDAVYKRVLAELRTLDDADRRSLTESLSADQMKRFEQIVLQGRGFAAFGEPDVQKALRLTEDQQTRIEQIVDRGRQEVSRISERVGELQKGGKDPRTLRETFSALYRENNQKCLASALAVLTDGQKAQWKAMIGAPFEFEPAPPAR